MAVPNLLITLSFKDTKNSQSPPFKKSWGKKSFFSILFDKNIFKNGFFQWLLGI